MLDTLNYKKGGKTRQKQRQKQKQKQTVNIKNVINVGKSSKSKTKPRAQPRAEPAPQYSSFTKLFVGQPNDFRSVAIGNPALSSDNVIPTQRKIEDIVNGRVKQAVNEAIDNKELERINNELRTPLTPSLNTPANFHLSPANSHRDIFVDTASERSVELSNPPVLERQRQVEEIKEIPTNHEEKQVIESGITIPDNATYEEMKTIADSRNIRIPAGKNKDKLRFNIENNIQKGKKGNFGPRK